MTQTDHFGLSNSNYGVKVVECSVLNNRGHSAHFTSDFKDNRVLPSEESVMQRSAIHDIGIPEPCTDIVHLLIDDLLHMSEEKVDRYYRVWCSSGEATLVSSTTARSFNAAGCLVEVRHRTQFVERVHTDLVIASALTAWRVQVQVHMRAISVDEYDDAVRCAPSSCPSSPWATDAADESSSSKPTRTLRCGRSGPNPSRTPLPETRTPPARGARPPSNGSVTSSCSTSPRSWMLHPSPRHASMPPTPPTLPP